MPKKVLCLAALFALLLQLAVAAGARFMPPRQLFPGEECADVTELPADSLIPERELPLGGGSALVTERSDGTRQIREYRDASDNRFLTLRQLCDGTESSYLLWSETMTDGTEIRFRDPDSGVWTAQPLTEGEYTVGVVVLETPEGETLFLSLPLTFIEKEHTVLEHQPSLAGILTAERMQGGFAVSVIGFGNQESSFVDFSLLSSPLQLFDWEEDNWAILWDRYTGNGESLMSFSGYLRFTPNNYDPSGKNCYYRCPAAFLAQALMWQMDKSVSASLVTAAILDTAMQAQNPLGYFPTEPRSGWLSGDYGIGHDFYDTRFNTDVMEVARFAREKNGGGLFRQQTERYLTFYCDFAENHHVETANGGWLVSDYWSSDMAAEPHTSLNHQLAECLLLYRLEDEGFDPSSGALADRLLLAVEDTGADWVKEDHDLHYCRYADGSYGAKDYPDLTYKDLVKLKRYLERERSRTSPTLDLLIEEKGRWMDANGVKR